MERLKIAICDDDAVALGIVSGALGGLLEKREIQADITTYRNAAELEVAMRAAAFDLILLDIDLPDVNGIDFFAKSRKEGNRTQIMFVSGHENSVFDAFKCEPAGFVRKSHFLKDLTVYIDLFLKKYKENRTSVKTLSVKSKKQILLISVEDITYIESFLKNQHIFAVNGSEEYQITSSMKKLEEELAPYGFIRIHNGYLVNYRYIKLFTNCDVQLTNGKSLLVSRGRMHSARERFMELMSENGVLPIE